MDTDVAYFSGKTTPIVRISGCSRLKSDPTISRFPNKWPSSHCFRSFCLFSLFFHYFVVPITHAESPKTVPTRRTTSMYPSTVYQISDNALPSTPLWTIGNHWEPVGTICSSVVYCVSIGAFSTLMDRRGQAGQGSLSGLLNCAQRGQLFVGG